jgi:hypothetical protein
MLVPRLKAAADELPGLRTRAAELGATAVTHKMTLHGSSDTIAAANLQSRSGRWMSKSGPAPRRRSSRWDDSHSSSLGPTYSMRLALDTSPAMDSIGSSRLLPKPVVFTPAEATQFAAPGRYILSLPWPL